MRENRTHGSEGGEDERPSLPLSTKTRRHAATRSPASVMPGLTHRTIMPGLTHRTVMPGLTHRTVILGLIGPTVMLGLTRWTVMLGSTGHPWIPVFTGMTNRRGMTNLRGMAA